MTTTESKAQPIDIIFSPQQMGRLGTSYLEQKIRYKGMGIPLGIPSIDADFLPAFPGDLITVIARPGNGKTGFKVRWARQRAAMLRERGILDRAVVYITYEQHVEDLESFVSSAETAIDIERMARGEITDDELEILRVRGTGRAGTPLWFIGHSQERRKKRPNITLPMVYDALSAMEEWEVEGERNTKIDMIFVDYLQRIPFSGNPESKTVGMDSNLNQLKDLALSFACPLVCGVQAKREVDDRKLPIPQMEDGQWTSAIEQVSDKIFGLVRPRKYRREGEEFGSVIVRGHTQMFIALLKQKLGKDNLSYWVNFAPEYNRLDEAELVNVNLNQRMSAALSRNYTDI